MQARRQKEWKEGPDPGTFPWILQVLSPVFVSRYLALRMNADRRDYRADK
jgi:hypothetical protein